MWINATFFVYNKTGSAQTLYNEKGTARPASPAAIRKPHEFQKCYRQIPDYASLRPG